jgi:2-polyprenyl-3-methyl-5-hydroxy-6-metoxy-1,4-benzoquinol methylase
VRTASGADPQTRPALPSDCVLYNLEDPNEAALSRIPEGAVRVLDVGCGSGANGRWLAEHGFESFGLTHSIEEASLARRSYRGVVVSDAEKFFPCPAGRSFDAILFIDTLEHFRDPWSVLENCRSNLGESGAIVAFIPNIGHLAARLALLAGSFRYTRTGLMDRTHLRFFDRKSVRELFTTSGYRIEASEDVWTRTPPFPRAVRAIQRALLALWPSAFARHFLIVARPQGSVPAAR